MKREGVEGGGWRVEGGRGKASALRAMFCFDASSHISARTRVPTDTRLYTHKHGCLDMPVHACNTHICTRVRVHGCTLTRTPYAHIHTLKRMYACDVCVGHMCTCVAVYVYKRVSVCHVRGSMYVHVYICVRKICCAQVQRACRSASVHAHLCMYMSTSRTRRNTVHVCDCASVHVKTRAAHVSGYRYSPCMCTCMCICMWRIRRQE